MQKIKIDMNNPDFQRDLFLIEKDSQFALIRTLKKISNLNWFELYQDHELKWEVITSNTTKNHCRIYSFRFSQKYRACAYREENFLRLLKLHIDHDGAYEKK